MKMYKKIISFTLAAFLLISNFQLPLTYAEDNIKTPPPNMDNLVIDKNEVKSGDSINISIRLYTISSARKNFYIWYKSPNGFKTKFVSLKFDSKTAAYIGTLDIDNTMENGTWNIDNMTLTDSSDNATSLYSTEYDFSALSFNVSGNDHLDVTAPALDMDSLHIDKKDVTLGDSINISLKAYDDKSGIKQISILYKHPETPYFVSVPFTYDESTDSYIGTLTVDNTMENGAWNIYSISLYDNEDNSAFIYHESYDLSSLNFNVYGNGNIDVTGPIVDINSLNIDKKEVKPGDSINVSIKASDNESGINSFIIWYNAPVTSKNKYINLTYNNSTDSYVGSLTIDEYMEGGTWTLDTLAIKDNAGNSTYMHSDTYNFSALNFNVSNENTDTTPPKLDVYSIKIDSIGKDFMPKDIVKVYLKASDNKSGIKELFAVYKCRTSLDQKTISFNYDSYEKCYAAAIDIDESMENTSWYISDIYLSDNADNSIFYCDYDYDFSDGSFNVVKYDDNVIHPLEDVTVVKGYEVWSNKTIKGDVYIAPDSLLKINGKVKISGKVYVLGTLMSYGGLSCQSVCAKRYKRGTDNFSGNGVALMEGINYDGIHELSDYPIKDIPVRIDNEPLIRQNGKVSLKGATADIADMYIDGEKVELSPEGTFYLKDLFVGTYRTIDLEFVTVFGNTITKRLYVDYEREDLSYDGYINMTDLSLLGSSYNQTSESADWNSRLDINKDGIIDIYDITSVSSKIENQL